MREKKWCRGRAATQSICGSRVNVSDPCANCAPCDQSFKEAEGESAHRPLCVEVEKNLAEQNTPSRLTQDPAIPKREDPGPLCAAHTPNFPALLRQLGASLLVTTYQAGKLVMVRDEGDHLNTHFRTFQAPMGMALEGGRLAFGTTIQVWEYVDVPAVAARLDPPGRHDAC